VFGGDLDRVVALRSTTGEELWEYNAGGQVTAAPITYGVNGKQYFAVVAGSVFMAFTLPENSVTANRVATAPLSPQRGN
jgi:glucose dehydrogenase